MNAESRVIRLTMPAKAEYIGLCRLALAGISRSRPLPDETLADLKLALTEACSNSVRHAYDEGSEGTVHIVYELGDDEIAIEVTDHGAGFTLDDGDGPPGEMTESGLGIAVIRALADELEIEHGGNGIGSRLWFVKRFGES